MLLRRSNIFRKRPQAAFASAITAAVICSMEGHCTSGTRRQDVKIQHCVAWKPREVLVYTQNTPYFGCQSA